MGGIILCTRGVGAKASLLTDVLRAQGRGNIPIGFAAPNAIPEAAFNDLTAQVELVALMKTLQHSSDTAAMVQGVLGRNQVSGLVFLVANDVMLDTSSSTGGWDVHNKPPETMSRKDLLGELVSTFSARTHGPIKCRVRVGCAALEAKSRRGVAGVVEQFFWVRPIPQGVLERYVYETTEGLLKHTNFGVRWERPPFRDHIEIIGEVHRSDEASFREAEERFVRLIIGAPSELVDLLDQAQQFALARSGGDLTPIVNRVVRDFPQITSPGNWRTWRPRGDTRV